MADRAVMTLALVAALCGCQSRVRERGPIPGGWTTVDAGRRDVASARDAVIRDAVSRDAAREDGEGSVVVDATGGGRDGGARDLGGRDADAHDLGGRDAGRDLRPADGAATDSSSPYCGSGRFLCTPFICDVDAGQCKTFCTGNEDCVPGRSCVNGFCGPRFDEPCIEDQECASGHCANAVCCATACASACQSCALAGTLGVCSPVPAATPDPQRICPAGTVCGADAGCVPAPDAAASI
jgi:hypothetical protein